MSTEMQVYPEPPSSSAATFASSTTGYGVGKPEALPFTSQPSQQPPPPAYAPQSYQPAANAYGFNPSVGTAPPQYGAPSGYGFAPAGYGYPMGSMAPQTQIQNSQNMQVNVVQATASPAVIVTQPAIDMTPPSYLGWSIFNFLCCFWPLGLAAIIYSVKVGSARNHEEAKSYSLTARNLNIAATTIAPILVIVIAGAVVGVAASAVSSGYYANSYYNSYGYYNYYSYLMYYTYYNTYSYLAYTSYYSYLSGTYYYTYTAYGYISLTASKYATGYYYYG